MSGGSKQTQTTQQQPYKAAQPLMNKGMGDTLKLYNQGNLVKPNTMSTVVPFSNQSTQAMGAMQDTANANLGGQGLSGQYQGVIDRGGFNEPQQTAVEGFRQTATGDFDVNANPAFQQVLTQAQDAASNAVNRNAAGMGRYGSGTHQGVMAREIGDLTARMTADEYRNWQGRQDTARQNLFNAGQTGMGNLGTAYQGMQAPADTLRDVGGAYEDLAGRQLNDQLRISQEQQNAPLANIQALLAAAGGAGGYGTNTTTAQAPGSTASNLMGGLLGGASLLEGLWQ